MSSSSGSRLRRSLLLIGSGVLLAGLIATFVAYPSAQQVRQAPRYAGYIGGTVESSQGKEAGVWVIAETNDTLTKFIKIVVTDDQGRFVLPELPAGNYDVWVRGYGLADSTPVKSKPGETALALKAAVAKTPQEAAKVYPANYWYSLIEPPAKSEFPGTGPNGNGIGVGMTSQERWIDVMKQGCELCHQVGTELTRTLHSKLPKFATHEEAWDYRVQTGQRGTEMNNTMDRFGRKRALKMFADWTRRIEAGEVPEAPTRPKGIERNLVLTMWDWGTDHSFNHDQISTSKQNPRVNAWGPVYAASAGAGAISVVDPVENVARDVVIPTRDDAKAMPGRFPNLQLKPSNFWGDELLFGQGVEKADPHNPMMDNKGRLWLTSAVRDRVNPDYCKNAAQNKYAAYFPLDRSSRQTSFYEPSSNKWTLISTCFGTHHLQFDEKNDKVFYTGGGPVFGWVDVKMYEQTHDEKASQGWCAAVLDTNGDGKITKPFNEPIANTAIAQQEGGGGGRLGKIDPKLDTRIERGSYGVVVSPTDNSVWFASTNFPGHIMRLDLGKNPPETCMTELYTVPVELGYASRGIDVDRNGVIWTALSGNSSLASFDRTKCKTPFNAMDAAQDKLQCREGWTVVVTPGPNMKGTNTNADFQYYNWVDQFNTLGLGENLPVVNGTGSNSLQVFMPKTGEWVQLRVPYPLGGFYSRGLDGRIDDPKTGWKGRGLWSNNGSNEIWHQEGGKGTRGKEIRFQMRPDPLAR